MEVAGRLGGICRAARKAHHPAVTMLDVAQHAGVSQSAISAFELGVSLPRRLDVVVAAYEAECGLEDGELWQRAVSS